MVAKISWGTKPSSVSAPIQAYGSQISGEGKFCDRCGAQIPKAAGYCSSCGQKQI
jgi:predicted amidophosphoribosyltransferase